MLEPSTISHIPGRVQPPPPPAVVEGEIEYEIEEILDSKIDRCYRLCNLLYLVRWAGSQDPEDETTWMQATELKHAPEAIQEFHGRYPDKLGPWKTS